MTALNVLKFTNSPVQDLELMSRKPLVVEFRVFEKTKIKTWVHNNFDRDVAVVIY